jgi:uncharacterized protein (TIRG00374 family)
VRPCSWCWCSCSIGAARRSSTAAVLRFLPERFGNAVKRITGAIVAGMRVLPNPRLVLAVFLVTVAMWFLPILSSYVMMRAFDLQLPFGAAVVVFIFIGFGTALPNVPGMIGPYQYACILALDLFGVPKSEALAYGLVLNAVQFLSIVGQGLVAWPLAGISVADLRQGDQRRRRTRVKSLRQKAKDKRQKIKDKR